jgi:hypothetical protein
MARPSMVRNRAPAVGRGVVEQIIYGGFRSLDLSSFLYAGFVKGERVVVRHDLKRAAAPFDRCRIRRIGRGRWQVTGYSGADRSGMPPL